MNSSKFEEFLNKVTSKVKSKEAHSMIKKELTNHLQELSQSFQKREHSKEEAEDKAIREMGNPFTIGENLNRLHKPRIDWLLITLFIIISGIGFLPLIGGVPNIPVPSTYYIERRAILYTLAVIVIVSFLFFDYRKLRKWWTFFYCSGLILLIYTNLFGYTVMGGKRWVAFFGGTIDVTITILFFYLAWAGLFTRIQKFAGWKKQLLLFILVWIPVLYYITLPDIMFCIIYLCCVLVMFAFSQAPKIYVITFTIANVLVGLIVASTLFYTRGEYFITRLLGFINPEEDSKGAGYIYIVVKNALSEAGWFGNGLNKGPTHVRFPEAHTDFAFPYLVYSLGWAFGIFLCILLVVFILRISSNAFKTKDLYGRLLVIGGTALFTIPTFWNILMGFGLVPIMGVSLPLISYGGSLLLFYAAIIGLILNVYRRKDFVEPSIVE